MHQNKLYSCGTIMICISLLIFMYSLWISTEIKMFNFEEISINIPEKSTITIDFQNIGDLKQIIPKYKMTTFIKRFGEIF